MGSQFKILASGPFLSYVNNTILMAITSARRVYGAWVAFDGSVSLHIILQRQCDAAIAPKFVSKMVFQFHLKIHASVFSKLRSLPGEQHLHTLDVRRCLAFYLERTKPFWASPHLCHMQAI